MADRREKLRIWRQETGRTPMKRFSYVAECSSRPPTHTVPHTPKPAAFKVPPLSAKRRVATSRQSERMTPAAQGAGRGAAEMRVLVCSSQQTLSKTERGYMRRQMLEEWRAQNGRVLKRPPLFLKPVNCSNNPQQAKKTHRRRHTIGGGGGGRGRGGERKRLSVAQRKFLKEQFQRELVEEWVEETREGGGGGEMVCHPLRASPQGGERKESTDKESLLCLYTTPPTVSPQEHNEHTFRSTKVRFMLSEPHRRRTYCGPCIPTPNTVYVTPVRRSTREGRNRDGPGMKLDENRCFDSPSEISKHLEFDNLQMITNHVLQLV